MNLLNERIAELERQVSALMSQVSALSSDSEEKYSKPISIVGGQQDKTNTRPIDVKTGLGRQSGGPVVWNDSESKIPPINAEPEDPAKGYNKHSHSRYSGGALIKDVLEIVEYVWGSITNKHSQQYWTEEPEIATDTNSAGETVNKIGKLELVFNADTKKWGSSAFEIDVKKCYLVEKDSEGNIVVDSKGNPKKSLLLNNDTTKTAIVWDENASVWRWYAVYAPGT